MPTQVYIAMAVVVILAGIACWRAVIRIGAHSYPPLFAIMAALLGGAGLCWGISLSNTGGFLSGIIGYLSSMTLLCIAAGLLFGVVLGLAWRLAGREKPAGPSPQPLPAWDVIGFSVLSLIFVMLSAFE